MGATSVPGSPLNSEHHDATPTTTVGQGVWARLGRDVSLLRVFVPRELRLRYRNSLLDMGWALIGPAVTLAVYGVVLTQSFDVSAACGTYLQSAWLGLVMWTTFATGLGGAASSLVSSAPLITKVYLPKEALPLAQVGSATIEGAVGLAILFVLLLVQGAGINLQALWLVPAVAVLLAWTCALSVFVAAMAVFARDLVHATSLALRVGFFASPVMYESNHLPSAFAWTARYNPVAVCIDAARAALLCGERPDLALLAAHGVAAVIALAAAVAYTARVEPRIADLV